MFIQVLRIHPQVIPGMVSRQIGFRKVRYRYYRFIYFDNYYSVSQNPIFVFIRTMYILLLSYYQAE